MAQAIKLDSPESTARTAPAPYLPLLTFQSAIESLEHGIPKKIDRTIWRSQSGIIQSQILMALRFFGLVDNDDRPTQLLHEFVEKKDERKRLMADLVNVAYAEIIKHDLTKMTPRMLEDAIDQYNVSGDTKRKAVTFFLKAAKFADIPMHPSLSSQVRNTGPRKRKAGKKPLFVPAMNGRADTPPYDSGQQRGNSKTVRLSGGGTVTIAISADPFTLPSDDRQFVFELVDKLQAYSAAHPVGEEGDEEGAEEE